MTIEQQLADTQAEVVRLRNHNDTLLTEKKRLQESFNTLQEQHNAATERLTALQLDAPVDTMVNTIAIDPKLFKTLWAENYQFALDDEGNPCVQTKDGQPITTTVDGKEVPLAFDSQAIVDFLIPRSGQLTDEQTRWARVLRGNGSSGGGAGGGAGPNASRHPAPHDKPQEPARVQFGLK